MRHRGYWSRLQPVISGNGDSGMDDTIDSGRFAGHSAQEVRESQARQVVVTAKSVGDAWFGFVMYDPRVGKDVMEYTADNEEDILGWYDIAKRMTDAETIGYYHDGELIDATKNPKWLGEIREPMTRDTPTTHDESPPSAPVVKKHGIGTGVKLAFAAVIAGVAGLVLGGHGKKGIKKGFSRSV